MRKFGNTSNDPLAKYTLAKGFRVTKLNTGMYKPKWLGFTWNLNAFSNESKTETIMGDLRLAEKPDEEACNQIVERALITERGWGVHGEARIREMKDFLRRAFGPDTGQEVVVWEDGRRLVGLSALCLDAESPRQLVSGVCIYEEYRCRGGGTALLQRSLERLAENGLDAARVVTRERITAARFLYPKFQSKIEELDECPPWQVPVAKAGTSGP